MSTWRSCRESAVAIPRPGKRSHRLLLCASKIPNACQAAEGLQQWTSMSCMRELVARMRPPPWIASESAAIECMLRETQPFLAAENRKSHSIHFPWDCRHRSQGTQYLVLQACTCTVCVHPFREHHPCYHMTHLHRCYCSSKHSQNQTYVNLLNCAVVACPHTSQEETRKSNKQSTARTHDRVEILCISCHTFVKI